MYFVEVGAYTDMIYLYHTKLTFQVICRYPPSLHACRDQLAGENSQKNAELKLREEEVAALKGEIMRVSKLREGAQRKLRLVEEQKAEVESTRDSLKQQIASLERGERSKLHHLSVEQL